MVVLMSFLQFDVAGIDVKEESDLEWKLGTLFGQCRTRLHVMTKDLSLFVFHFCRKATGVAHKTFKAAGSRPVLFQIGY